ncbi:hypothetical protein ACW7BC_31175 [Azospirillum argentinense]
MQVGQQSSRGLEASLSLGLWEGVRGDVNGALLRTKYDDFIQTVSGRAGTHRQCLGKLGLPAGLGGAGRRAVYRQDLRRRRQHRHAARLYSGQRRPGYRPTDNTKLSLRAFNLFDEVYAVASGTTSWKLGRPRSAELAFSMTF